MTANAFRLTFLACTAAMAASAFAGPDPVDAFQADPRPKQAAKWHKKIVEKVLVACGVVEPPPVYVAPGYLETTGPAPMMIYRAPSAIRPRRVTQPEGEGKTPAAVTAVEPAASPSPAPAVNPAASPAPAPVTPVPAPAPTDAEPSVLPESDANGSAAHTSTDEMLSYFQRQHAVAHPYTASPLPPGGAAANDPNTDPSFLQAPQPEQPVLPPSRATYHVVP